MQFKATLIALAITFIGVNAAPQLGLPGLSSLGGLTGGVTNGAEGGATSGGATSVINEVISVLGGATGGDIGNPYVPISSFTIKIYRNSLVFLFFLL